MDFINRTTLQPTGEKDIIAVTTQDVEPILEANKVLRSMGQKSDWGRHVARVPNNIINQWLHEEWNKGNHALKLSYAEDSEFMKIVRRKLNDPDWAWLRVDKQPSGHAVVGYGNR